MKNNKVKFGLKNVHFAPIVSTTGTYTYDAVKQQKGAVSISLSKQGEVFKKYADDVEFFNKAKNNGYTGSLVLTDLTDEFIEYILGWTKDANGVWFENAGDQMKHFALGFEIQGDAKARRFWFYDCYIERPNLEGKTQEESMATDDDTLNLYAIPRTTDGEVRALSFAGDAAYDEFFNTVYQKASSI